MVGVAHDTTHAPQASRPGHDLDFLRAPYTDRAFEAAIDFAAPIGGGPLGAGFERFFGMLGVVDMYQDWQMSAYSPEITSKPERFAAYKAFHERGDWLMQGVAGKPLERVKPMTLDTTANMDQDFAAWSENFIREASADGKPFYLVHSFSKVHFFNIPAEGYAGRSPAGTPYRDGVVEVQPGVHLYRQSRLTERVHASCQPAFCVIAQGRQAIWLGEDSFQYDPAHYLIASMAVPLTGEVVEASPQRPYLSLRLVLDPAVATSVMVESGFAVTRGDTDVTKYSWDNRNRLVKVVNRAEQGGDITQTVRYTYEPENRLIAEKIDADG